ncbi:zinc finger C2HC domain-containing protein 1C [Zerene cesonia]|uniref:zinc finger C2HC domain-containing protein 1C n=1 Tax=Zerene cesonia TaxID=33412 RepID=UPI0018E4F33D|nr:zinc finger C2HC domain-containing protein 1C [Zerene cesonia]
MEKTGGSRLLQMQARFQQKQLQEKELKIASLYEAQQARALDRVRHSPSNGNVTTPSPPMPHQPGKVRQMFEERRTKAGIDKSYPLQPIQNTERAQPRKALPNGYTKVSNTTTKATLEKKTSIRAQNTVSSHSVRKQITQVHKVNSIVNGSGDLNHNHELDLNAVKTLSKSNGREISSVDELDRVDNNYMLENETFPEALAPVTPRSPEPEELKRLVKRNPPPQPIPTTKATKPVAKPAVPKKVSNENVVAENTSKPRGVMQRVNPVPRRTPVSPQASSGPKVRTGSGARAGAAGAAGARGSGGAGGAAGAAGDACAVCGRRFAPDRLAKHQEICRKTHAKRRKPFDVIKHRLAGTEAEPFIGKLRKGASTSSSKVSKSLNNNWRQKHEEFIQAIRAAKQVQAHLNAGGKLSDLPPPPPSENPDYVQCPHCNRRFNQAAAERHIPKCASFQFNKPKPAAKRR